MKNNGSQLKQFAKGQATSKLDKGTTCIIYTRVSSKEQADTNQSLEWQKKYCINYATKNNLAILGYFGGTYESAKSDERKEFNRMLKFVKGQKVKVSYILVYSLDRFSRTGDSAIYIAGELKKIGVNLLAVTQPIDSSTHAGALQQNIQFIFSKYDNDLRRQKSVDGMREKLLRGEWLGNTPTGYAYDRTHGTKEQRIVITEKGKIIKQAFEWRAEGRTYEQISERLAKAGYKIAFQLLTDLFRNPFYCGMLSHNLLGGELVKGKHPALVSEELFLKANQQCKTSGFKMKVVEENLPLRRFVKDSETEIPFTGYLVKKKNKYYYKVNKVGIKINRSIDIMHSKFKEVLYHYTIPEQAIEPLKVQLQYTWENLIESNAELRKTLSTKITELESKIDKLEERHAFGEISSDVYTKFTSRLVEEKTAVSDQLEKITQKISNPQQLINFTCKLASKLPLVWADSSFHQKQAIQNLIFPFGILYDSKIEHYRTTKVKHIFQQMSGFKRVTEGNENGSHEFSFNDSRSVARRGIEPLFPG